MTSSINISKIITVIDTISESKTVIHSHKMSEFSSLISERNNVTVDGHSNPAKKEKYHKMLIEQGFSISCINWLRNAGFEGENSDVLHYSILYTK